MDSFVVFPVSQVFFTDGAVSDTLWICAHLYISFVLLLCLLKCAY